MFFKLNILKKLFKDAYKSAGLTIGHTAADEGKEGYYMSSGWWVMWFDVKNIPKEVKAAAIELSGELPQAGEVFRTEKGMGNQYEIRQERLYDLPAVFETSHCRFRVTGMLMKKGEKLLRVVQEEGKTYKVVTMPDSIISMIDRTMVDSDRGEKMPAGPFGTDSAAKWLIWGNGTCYLLAGVYDITEEKEQEFLKYLEGREII